jgi:adenosylhomocysteine nucleosidase
VRAGRREPGFVIAATGLLAEARIAARSGDVKTVVSGGNATRLAGLIEGAIAEGGRAIVSFGIAGGLRDDVKAGDCLIASEVVHAGELYRADAEWTARLAKRVNVREFEHFLHRSRRQPPPTERERAVLRVAGVDQALSIPADKRALNAATGAAAADMESHIVAGLAVRHRLPFAVVRAIADPVRRGLPRAALVGMRSDGTTDIGACLRSLVRDPAEAPALVRVAIDTSRAMLQLLRCVQTLGPGLGFFDCG